MIVAHHVGEDGLSFLARAAAGTAPSLALGRAWLRAKADSRVEAAALLKSPRTSTEETFSTPPSASWSRSDTRGITTRRLAEEAGANAGLVHYYFGSMENLLVRVLERFTDRLIARQRAMYAARARSSTSGARRCATCDGTASTRRSGWSCRPWPGTGPSSARGCPGQRRMARGADRSVRPTARRVTGSTSRSTRWSRW